MIRALLVGMVFLGLAVAKAEVPFEVGATVGLHVSDWSYDGAGYDTESSTGLIVGATIYREVSPAFTLRTGGYYSQRKGSLKDTTSSVETDFEVASVDVPVTAMFEMASGFGVFAGGLFSLKVSDDCSGDAALCDTFDPETFMTSASLGISARVHPNWSAEAFYNLGLSEAAKDLDVNSAGIQLVFVY